MKRIQNFDYFRKNGEHAKATRTGGIVSILSLVVSQACCSQFTQTISYLIATQYNQYTKALIKKDTIVAVDMHKGTQYVQMNIDLVLPYAPCQSKIRVYILSHVVMDIIIKTGYT